MGPPRAHLLRYIAGRIAGAVLVLIVVAAAVFWLFELLPGDAATILASRNGAGRGAPEQLAALRAELGLDRPAWERFFDWLGAITTGDLGESLLSRRPVSEVLEGRLLNSVVLAMITVVFLLPLSLLVGLWAGSRPGSRSDRFVSTVSLAAESMPAFVIGVLLIAWLALGWGLFPAVSLVPTGTNPLTTPEVLVLPVICLLFGLAPHPMRIVRAQMAEVMASDYIRAARINGIPHHRLVLRHAAPNAISGALHPMAGAVVGLIGGVAIVEVVFAYPGLAQELIRAISARDLPFVQSVAVLLAAFGLIVYLIADIVAIYLTPHAATALKGRR